MCVARGREQSCRVGAGGVVFGVVVAGCGVLGDLKLGGWGVYVVGVVGGAWRVLKGLM